MNTKDFEEVLCNVNKHLGTNISYESSEYWAQRWGLINAGINKLKNLIAITPGLLDLLENKEQAYCLIGHEMGHYMDNNKYNINFLHVDKKDSVKAEVFADTQAHIICKALNQDLEKCASLFDLLDKTPNEYYPNYLERKNIILTGEYVKIPIQKFDMCANYTIL